MTDRLDEDIKLVDASSHELADYLLSKVLFWRVNGLSVPLTPGNLLLALKRLSGFHSDLKNELQSKVDRVVNEHRAAWLKKIREESTARLNQWENILQEYHEDGFVPSAYPSQVRIRVILSLLQVECPYPDSSFDRRLEALDDTLKDFLDPGEFVWETSLALIFPENGYWYLYKDLKRTKNGKILYR